ncbi:MAG TPA: avidin/streptavidin family protein [Azospirillum sp.]|nr:avidin/streptavidin family protein [Azospirillum sp.]
MTAMITTATHWVNEYGSTMDLWQAGDGAILGVYKSSTGSTGTYLVVGWAAGAAPSAQLGQAVSLSIFWRSLEGGTGDASWHWVSGLGGQHLLGTGGQPDTMPLNHALVATTEFVGLAGPGTYIDKLLYRAQGAPPSDLAAPEFAGKGAGTDPVNGVWQCREQPDLRLKLQVTDTQYGFVEGAVIQAGGSRPIRGLTDTYAQAAGVALQGLSVTAPIDDAGRTLSLSGSLNRRDGVLTLTAFTSQGTAPGNTYLQTTLGALSFRKVA